MPTGTPFLDNHSQQSEITETSYSWPDSPTPAATASTPCPTNLPLTAADPGQDSSILRCRKRKSENAAEPDLRKRKKSSSRAIADALEKLANEAKKSRLLLSYQLKRQEDITARQFDRTDIASRVVNIIVSEFDELSIVEQDIVISALVNTRSRALLFLARPERRSAWVDYLLAQRQEC